MDREEMMRSLEEQAAQAVQDGDLARVAELRDEWKAAQFAGEATRG